VKLGAKLFGDKFSPLLDFMPFENYMELLGKIDVAVFAHKRQQAMGNIVTLLGLGKKIYMRSNVTSWMIFSEQGIKVFDVDKLDLKPIEEDLRKKNQARIKSIFNEVALVGQLHSIFKR